MGGLLLTGWGDGRAFDAKGGWQRRQWRRQLVLRGERSSVRVNDSPRGTTAGGKRRTGILNTRDETCSSGSKGGWVRGRWRSPGGRDATARARGRHVCAQVGVGPTFEGTASSSALITGRPTMIEVHGNLVPAPVHVARAEDTGGCRDDRQSEQGEASFARLAGLAGSGRNLVREERTTATMTRSGGERPP
jgi:hypothetical protein